MQIPVWALIPFVVQLLVIAVAPLFFEHFWEKNRNKLIVSLLLSIPIVCFMLANGMATELEHQILFDYLPFIILLCALFVITGGIHLSGDLQAKPSVNTTYLAIGYVLASIMGTTGAAMLLIRPVLTTNQQRKFKTHTVLFFIAAVANCGGLLTPLGDPPLFLIYLRGAEFTWFLKLLPQWVVTGVALLTIYYLVDKYYYFKREAWTAISADLREKTPFRTHGNINFVLLLGVILSVAFVNAEYIPQMNAPHAPIFVKFLREIALTLLIIASVLLTKKDVRARNKFTWTPILEVAALFLGIFVTMTPALLYLNQHAATMGLHSPWHFYYATGALSSFLDNAPTALAFHSVAQGLPEIGTLVAGVPEILLKAIAVGAVFFGAMTYIGNGPNFMVKAIAEENGIPMPSFFAYMFTFSLIVLLPIYVIVQLLFF
ncbi:MAG: sodium:proton antiporter [Prevotellaceae bacterium]|jgi:Na+/H+ antiporter NhaD/arsenite permease-like protein|nr:sodium:proton antiporter [Prevotellaceae bacterium]